MSKTFIISQPYKVQKFALSKQDKEDNRISRAEALASWLAFAREVASHFRKGWFVELKDNDEHLYVNGNLVNAEFKNNYLLVSNQVRFADHHVVSAKKVVQLYYNTNLSIEKHGAKLVAVVEDVIAHNIRDNANKDKTQENIKLGVEIMKELVHNHNFQIIDPKNEEAGGYKFTADPNWLTFRFYDSTDKWTPIWRIDYNIDTEKAKLSISQDGLNMRGNYNDIVDATGKFSTIVGLVNQMGREFVVISKIVPEIVKKIKG